MIERLFKFIAASLLGFALITTSPNLQAQVTPKTLSEESSYIQKTNKEKLREVFKSLNLNGAIEQGLRKNHDQELRRFQDTIVEIDWKDVKSSFWFPQLKITLQASQKVGRLLDGSLDNGETSSSPSGTLGLSLGEYTVFNWGKDYLQYLNDKATYLRTKEVLSESRRELKHNIIIKYFELSMSKAVEKIKRDQLRHASFVYRLNREKITVRKIRRQDYFQARAEFLRAQTEYQQAKVETEIVDESMALLINDEIGTRYILQENLLFEKIKVSETESRKISARRNPDVLNSNTNLSNVKRSYDISLKENLPLPKFTVNLGAYNHHFSSTQNRTFFETSADNSNVELIATINATWTLTGKDGLLNGRKNKRALYNRHLAYEQLAKSRHEAGSFIGQHFKRIHHLQTQMEILQARVPNLQKSFDTILENYLAKKSNYNDFHIALEELTEAETLLEQTRYLHLREKVLLAGSMGVEDFPGENFEKLAISKRDKGSRK